MSDTWLYNQPPIMRWDDANFRGWLFSVLFWHYNKCLVTGKKKEKKKMGPGPKILRQGPKILRQRPKMLRQGPKILEQGPKTLKQGPEP